MERCKNTTAIFALLAVVWVGALFFFSGQSGDDSGALSMAVTRFLFGGWIERGADFDRLHFLVRKAAHAGVFAVEGFLMAMSLMHMMRRGAAAMVTTFACFALAVANELHQNLADGRVCSPRDMLIDTLGATAGMAVAAILLCILGAIQQHKARKRQNNIDIEQVRES